MKSTRTVEGKSEVRNGVFRFLSVGVAAILQIAWVGFLLSYVTKKYPITVVITDFLALAIVIGIYSRHVNSAMKMPWIMLILSFPILGLVFYLEVGMSGANKAMERRFVKCKKVMDPLFPDSRAAHRGLLLVPDGSRRRVPVRFRARRTGKPIQALSGRYRRALGSGHQTLRKENLSFVIRLLPASVRQCLPYCR